VVCVRARARIVNGGCGSITLRGLFYSINSRVLDFRDNSLTATNGTMRIRQTARALTIYRIAFVVAADDQLLCAFMR
jgi:Ran GTPase-activating protein (RanGAP) involved in mRNA processing and transport